MFGVGKGALLLGLEDEIMLLDIVVTTKTIVTNKTILSMQLPYYIRIVPNVIGNDSVFTILH